MSLNGAKLNNERAESASTFHGSSRLSTRSLGSLSKDKSNPSLVASSNDVANFDLSNNRMLAQMPHPN